MFTAIPFHKEVRSLFNLMNGWSEMYHQCVLRSSKVWEFESVSEKVSILPENSGRRQKSDKISSTFTSAPFHEMSLYLLHTNKLEDNIKSCDILLNKKDVKIKFWLAMITAYMEISRFYFYMIMIEKRSIVNVLVEAEDVSIVTSSWCPISCKWKT